MADDGIVVILSDYSLSLDSHHQKRYREKINKIGVDPYLIATADFTSFINFAQKPNVCYIDIVNYLINTPSKYTGEALKSWKGLDAYSFFAAGWVQDVVISPINNTDLSVIIARVTHSQRLSEPPLRPWVIITQGGIVDSSHCTCMAGLGEVCSHVAALLFAVECGVWLSEGKTCTDVPCAWNRPSTATTSVPYATLFDIDFSNPKKKQKMSAENKLHVRRQTESRPIPPPTKAESQALHDNLHRSGKRCGVLALVEPYNKEYIPQVAHINCPKPLTTWFNSDLLSRDFNSLLDECSRVQQLIKVTPEQVKFVEQLTREQSLCALWHLQRTGCVTASIFRDVARTDVEKPSKSLLTRICYPPAVPFSSKATRWGCDHEKKAHDKYESLMMPDHKDLLICDAGLVLSQGHPFLGASPDGYVSCTCCGLGLIEVKCPYCKKDESVEDAAEDAQFCLESIDGVLELRRTHRYFYQVQAQMGVTGITFCDFVVWTNEGCVIQRIAFDMFFDEHCVQAAKYHRRVILPELLAKWFSRNPNLFKQRSVKRPNTSKPDGPDVICYCRKPVEQPVVSCESGICKISHFHLSCLRIKNVPKKKWTCPDCRKILKIQDKK